jgi:hypothetical protein
MMALGMTTDLWYASGMQVSGSFGRSRTVGLSKSQSRAVSSALG